MIPERRPQSAIKTDSNSLGNREAACLYALITDRRSVSRRNRASWYLGKLNKIVKCDDDADLDSATPIRESPIPDIKQEIAAGKSVEPEAEDEGDDIRLVSITSVDNPNNTIVHGTNIDHRDLSNRNENNEQQMDITNKTSYNDEMFLVTPSTRVLFLSQSIATSIILDLSPSLVSVSPQNGCVFLDSLFDALKRVLHLLVKSHEVPSSSSFPDDSKPQPLEPKVFVSVIAYTPFVVAKNNQVLIQNRRITAANIDQVLIEIWICLNRLTEETHELVSSTCGMNLDFSSSRVRHSAFTFAPPISGGVIRHPGIVLDDIYELGLFSSSLMPRLSRLSMIIISDGLFSSANNLNIFRLKSIAVSFVTLGTEMIHPNACFGYTPYIDLMKFVAKSTQGFYISHQDLMSSSLALSKNKTVALTSNPLFKLFCWSLHSETHDPPIATNLHNSDSNDDSIGVRAEQVTKFFCVDQPINGSQANGNLEITGNQTDQQQVVGQNYHDWRSFRQLDRNLDADFEQVLSSLLREGYLIKSIKFNHRETSEIVARLVLHWRHNLDLEQELTAAYWSNTDPFNIGDNNQLRIIKPPLNTPLYGDTYCEIIVHGSYSFLHNLYCDRRTKRRSEYRDIAYKQFRQLIDGVLQTHERLQYLSRFYRDSSLSKVPSFLLHGNSLLYEQPHTHRLTSTVENVVDETKTCEFQEYWKKMSCLDTKSWKNLMHVHTLRLVLEHDQPKHKNIHCQNANGRYTHVQCRRALSAISTFIKNYASFALLEDTTYIKFIYNSDDDLREIETSATKGFIVIRINKLLPTVVIHLMFTSGILDSHRVKIVSYLEEQLVHCKLRNVRATSTTQIDNILRSKTILQSSESCGILIKSPLERMLKVYRPNFITDHLLSNLAHGLPGSCPYSFSQSVRMSMNKPSLAPNGDSQQATQTYHHTQRSDYVNHDEYNSESSLNRYNLVFGKYIYGVRVVQTLSNLPYDIIPSLTSNVSSKISAILVNLRIKQGFHIAFNNSGIMNLVVELEMKDPINDDQSSSCLCQYIVFPPTVTNCSSQSMQQSVLINPSSGATSSRPGSLSGSLANSDSFMKNVQDSVNNLKGDNGEIKIIREYWIEQQYGISSRSNEYHESLSAKRYPEVVDHLFITDSSIFEQLLTYDLLQLLCDKLSPYYEFDSSLVKTESKLSPISSPTTSNDSSNNMVTSQPTSPTLPSTLIEGNIRDGNSKVPLIELEYKFSLVKFLDLCQQASLHVLLFKDQSEFYQPTACLDINLNLGDDGGKSMRNSISGSTKGPCLSGMCKRKMSVDVNQDNLDHQNGQVKREHRSSYQHDGSTTNYLPSTIYSPSLNHLFLETLHKRLKQMHDKELQLTEFDLQRLPMYLRRRVISGSKLDQSCEDLDKVDNGFDSDSISDDDDSRRSVKLSGDDELAHDDLDSTRRGKSRNSSRNKRVSLRIDWRCFLRKGNQENLMIVMIPSTLDDINKWVEFANQGFPLGQSLKYDPVCPIFVFRCSSSMINDHVLAFLRDRSTPSPNPMSPLTSDLFGLESDLTLHLGQPCKYMDRQQSFNDELNAEIFPTLSFGILNSANTSDEKSLELVHFRAFLRKVKNTVLKSRFSSLNDAYLSELFIHKDDILYYINNVDLDTQKKYHVSVQLKSLAEFIRSYEEFNDSLPQEPEKPCNHLLNSILLQKCGLFINQPITRFNEANPLMKQLHDKKLLCLMRRNYRVELPIIEESLSNSRYLKKFISPSSSPNHLVGSSQLGHYHAHQQQMRMAPAQLGSTTGYSSVASMMYTQSSSTTNHESPSPASSLGHSLEGARLVDMKSGSVGAGSPAAIYSDNHNYPQHRHRVSLTSKYPSPSLVAASAAPGTKSSYPSFANESIILEAFRNIVCPISEVGEMTPPVAVDDLNKGNPGVNLSEDPISLRHEAHMAEVLKRKSERKESHQYRRVLKSKTSYSHSHSAIDQALKRVDSLGRLEHFCLTPLLFSPSWRSKLAPVRDHTIEPARFHQSDSLGEEPSEQQVVENNTDAVETTTKRSSISSGEEKTRSLEQQNADEKWHQMVCNNYIKEYEQYIQTLGFNSVQIRYAAAAAASSSSSSKSSNRTSNTKINHSCPSSSVQTTTTMTSSRGQQSSSSLKRKSRASSSGLSSCVMSSRNHSNMASFPAGQNSMQTSQQSSYNTGYLIKFLNGGCLVFKVGFCKPYVYSILYSIEGERFNNSNTKLNMTSFLDELDNIKVTMHLHSFTYDYHLRSIYSYISGRQLTFSTGYHLISFVDDFRKYYQKAPNYARNHILSGEICISNLKVGGQQLYNYIVTHNSTYNMEVLEMSSNLSDFMTNLSSRSLLDKNCQKMGSGSAHNDAPQNQVRSHANDYVLIELKREKVRYKDGKDLDIFDCGLLITHDALQTSTQKNSLTLKYFLLFTNQRELYPKLVHTDDNIISLGCHRPIRLGVSQLGHSQSSSKTQYQHKQQHQLVSTQAIKSNNHLQYVSQLSSGHSDQDDVHSSEFQSSGEVSGPTSIMSTTNSVQSSTSGLQIGVSAVGEHGDNLAVQLHCQTSTNSSGPSDKQLPVAKLPKIKIGESQTPVGNSERVHSASSIEDSSSVTGGELSPTLTRRERTLSTNSNGSQTLIGTSNNAVGNQATGAQTNTKKATQQERTICDEEITYLGYFSSEEMDMLKFLQEKTSNLKVHIEQVVRLAEIHYRRDYLWHKLMQHPNSASRSSDEVPLTTDELLQLLQIIEAIDLATLDPQLSVFTTQHLGWYTKLFKAFAELKQSSINQHRIYTVRASKNLLLYIDPKCTSAFILLSIDPVRGSVELNMLLKDKEECGKIIRVIKSHQQQQLADGFSSSGSRRGDSFSSMIELDPECKQLINDFVNFCASFMWSTFLT